EGFGGALDVARVDLADVPRHEGAGGHAEVVQQRREVRVLDVDLADLDRDPLLERPYLDVPDLRRAVGDVELRHRARDDAPPDGELRREVLGEVEARDPDVVDLELSCQIGDGRLGRVPQLDVHADPALRDRAAAGAAHERDRRARLDVALEVRDL